METQEVNIPLSAMNLWFWMMDESEDAILREQSQNILEALFDDLAQARAYRAQLESEQFTLKHLCSGMDKDEMDWVKAHSFEFAN